MVETNVSSDHIIAELLDMGFEFDKALNALEAVGPCLNDAVEFILNNSCNKNTTYRRSQRALTCSKSQNRLSGKGANSSDSLCRMKQSNITDHIPSISRVKRDISASTSKPSFSGVKRAKSRSLDEKTTANVDGQHLQKVEPELSQMDSRSHMIHKDLDTQLQENKNFQDEQLPWLNNTDDQGIELDWEQRVNDALQRHFGFSSLKGFQREAVKAWLAHKDSLILAATGSGKSLCFQIPALLSEKIVVVISPLISLMHDQCLKLAKHGISACFLGSGQPDNTIERKAMDGVYRIVYVCPETVLRLVEPLMRLVENHRIALFAIDEVHCVSKWGHNFRPDYRRLSVLREKFSTSLIKSLKFDIPLMALTATATVPVREDIIKSLHMSKETKIVLTTFFRPNLRFSVKHSRTSYVSSYEKDFQDLVHVYTSSRKNDNKDENFNDGEHTFNCSSRSDVSSDEDGTSVLESYCNDNDSCTNLVDGGYDSTWGGQLSVEYLEDETDAPHSVDGFDVPFAEFLENGSPKAMELCVDPLEPLGGGPTIIYVPTRKETTKLAEYFCRSGVRAAAYHAKLPKAQLRHTHEEFHRNLIQVVVATIAFGMGIDKSNVRRIIHYGWPQSLEAYYQEAGRAGRDGKLSDCTLYVDFLKVPTLLPSQRSEEQTKQAYKMLSDCFRYGLNTATCRAKTLVNYFGEEFNYDGCGLCDTCTKGPPQKQNFTDEVNMFLLVLKAQCAYLGEISSGFVSHGGAIYGESSRKKLLERLPNFRDVITKIREQNPKFVVIDRTWWRGLSRILEDIGFIKEADGQVHVSIRNPQITKLAMEFLKSSAEETLYAYPYADMLLSSQNPKLYSSFSEWRRGWADPEIRRWRLQGRKHRARRTMKSRRKRDDLSTVRGRLAAKISKLKR